MAKIFPYYYKSRKADPNRITDTVDHKETIDGVRAYDY